MRLACCLSYSESDVESEVVGGKFGEGRPLSNAQRKRKPYIIGSLSNVTVSSWGRHGEDGSPWTRLEDGVDEGDGGW